MKITVHTLITNDDDGMQSQLFYSEAERDAAAWQWMAARRGMTPEELRVKFDGEIADAYEGFNCPGEFDQMNWGEEYLEIPDAPAEAAPARVAIISEGGAIQGMYSDTPAAVEVYFMDRDEGENWGRWKLDTDEPWWLDQVARTVAAETAEG